MKNNGKYLLSEHEKEEYLRSEFFISNTNNNNNNNINYDTNFYNDINVHVHSLLNESVNNSLNADFTLQETYNVAISFKCVN